MCLVLNRTKISLLTRLEKKESMEWLLFVASKRFNTSTTKNVRHRNQVIHGTSKLKSNAVKMLNALATFDYLVHCFSKSQLPFHRLFLL